MNDYMLKKLNRQIFSNQVIMKGRITSVSITPFAMHVSRRFLASISISLLLTACVSPVTENAVVNLPEKSIVKTLPRDAPLFDSDPGIALTSDGFAAGGTNFESADLTIADLTIVTTDGGLLEIDLTETQCVIATAGDADHIAEVDLWERIRNGFHLAHEIDRARVRQEIDWYKNHPDYIARVTKRAAKYLFYIVEELEARDMPLEIALLPIVESAFDPFAYSHGRASGLWQFIPATARLYNLRIDWWYDGRRDVQDSTQAAIHYLEKLYSLLNDDWLLALAAYNSGQGNIGNAIRRNKKAGKPVDFWSLKVLRETRSYVPRLLAISEIIAHPADYGIELEAIKNEAYWVEVDIESQLDLARAADLAGISAEDLYLLNPGYNQWSTHPDGPHHLLLPVEKADYFSSNLAELPVVKRMAWKRHKIREGENLGSIALRYNTTVESIKATNNLRGNMIRTGHSLTIPMASKSSAYTMTSDARLRNSQKYLEKKYGKKPIRYQVQDGDSFWKISRTYQIGMRELAKWNGMGTAETLHPGTELLIFKSPLMVSMAEAPSRTEVIRKVNYRVREGESLSLIANKFNLSINNIKEWNQDLHTRKYIQPGDRITLYVDVTATE